MKVDSVAIRFMYTVRYVINVVKNYINHIYAFHVFLTINSFSCSTTNS